MFWSRSDGKTRNTLLPSVTAPQNAHHNYRIVLAAIISLSVSLCIYIILLVPAQVTGVSLSKEVRSGAPALRVTWDTPQSDVAISRYEVQYRSGTQWKNAPVITVSPPATTTDLENLQAGTSYSVRVRAVSPIGDGDWSGDTMMTTYNGE